MLDWFKKKRLIKNQSKSFKDGVIFDKSGKPILKPIRLAHEVGKNNIQHESWVINLKDDLEEFYHDKLGNRDINWLTPYYYAYRFVFAIFYHQGMASQETFDNVDRNFYNLSLNIATAVSNEQQIKFQEISNNSAYEFIQQYSDDVFKFTVTNLVLSAKMHFCVWNVAGEILYQEIGNYETVQKISEQIITPDFVLGFFNYHYKTDDKPSVLHNKLQDYLADAMKDFPFNFDNF